MSPKRHSLLIVILSVCLLGVVVGCQPVQESDDRVLRVGVIASLSGPARPWGLATVRSAQVIADYYNDRGGFEVGGEKVRIELIVRDDAFDASLAASIAHDLVVDDVNYVIGPVGDGTVSAAARVLDGAGVFYVHYGFQQPMQNSSSLGVLGMPLPEQSLSLLFSHLREEQDVRTVLVMAYGSEEGIQQKGIAERAVTDANLELIKLSRYDVSEETFELDLKPSKLRRRVGQIVAAAPDALILTGCPPEPFLVLVDRLRGGGYEGVIGTQNFQDAGLLAKLGEAGDGVYYVGGESEGDMHSEYYEDLKASYLDLAGEWSSEVETKLYALEFILASIREAGPVALDETTTMYRALQKVRFEDPFYKESRKLRVVGGGGDGLVRQIQTPIRISKMLDSQAVLVKESVSLD